MINHIYPRGWVGVGVGVGGAHLRSFHHFLNVLLWAWREVSSEKASTQRLCWGQQDRTRQQKDKSLPPTTETRHGLNGKGTNGTPYTSPVVVLDQKMRFSRGRAQIKQMCRKRPDNASLLRSDIFRFWGFWYSMYCLNHQLDLFFYFCGRHFNEMLP